MGETLLSFGSALITIIISFAGIDKTKKKLRIGVIAVAAAFFILGGFFLVRDIRNNVQPEPAAQPLHLTINVDGKIITVDTSDSGKETEATPVPADTTKDKDEKILIPPRMILTSVNPAGEEQVLPVNAKGFIPLSSSDMLHVYADLSDNKLAVSWSSNEKYMNENEFMPNRNGTAILGYTYVSLTSEKKLTPEAKEKKADVINFDNPTFGEISLSDFEPGYYAIGVSAVGAADGLRNDDGTYRSNTGWTWYCFSVE